MLNCGSAGRAYRLCQLGWRVASWPWFSAWYQPQGIGKESFISADSYVEATDDIFYFGAPSPTASTWGGDLTMLRCSSSPFLFSQEEDMN